MKNTQTSVSVFIPYYFKGSSLFSVKSFRNQCQEKLVDISSQRCDLFDYFSDESVFS